MRHVVRSFVTVFLVFVLVFTLIGINHYTPRVPFLRLSFCVLGVHPTLSFGASNELGTNVIRRGTADIPVTAYSVRWPGGAAGVWVTPSCDVEPNPIARMDRAQALRELEMSNP